MPALEMPSENCRFVRKLVSAGEIDSSQRHADLDLSVYCVKVDLSSVSSKLDLSEASTPSQISLEACDRAPIISKYDDE